MKEDEPGQESRISPIKGMGKLGVVVVVEGEMLAGVLLCNKRVSCSAELQPPWEKMWRRAPSASLNCSSFVVGGAEEL